MKTIRLQIKKRLNEAFIVEPNDLGTGVLTSLYKMFTTHLKRMPFILIIPLSIFAVLLLYGIFNYLIVRLVSILQYGF